MQKLNITIKKDPEFPNAHIVHFEGDFDGYAKENLTQIQKFMDSIKNSTTLIFDFSKLNYLNSYAIGNMVAWHNHVNKMGGKIIIVGTNKDVEDIFAILGITSLFKVYPDLAAAKSELS